MLKTCGKLLTDPLCCGLVADNCSGMQDLKKAFLALAAKLKHVVFFVNCMWHGADSIGGALLGLGSGAERDMGFVLEDVAHPRTAKETVKWTLDMARKSSLPNKLKGIVKAVKNRHRLRGHFRKLQLERDALAAASWRTACLEANDNDQPRPPRPRKLPALRLPGKTRKLSHTGMFATCAANAAVLNDLFRSSIFDRYLQDQNAETRAMLTEVRDAVKDGVTLHQAGVWGEFFGLLQTFQRVTEAHDQNISDAVYNVCELLDRINGFPHPSLITDEVKEKVKKCILFRFRKLYTPDMALAVMCDPRRSFNACAELRQLLPEQPWIDDSLNCLRTRITVLPDYEQRLILRGYSRLVAGDVRFEEKELAAADDERLSTWWETYREVGGEEVRLLSQRVLERLYELAPAQAGVERLNSSFKFIQAGRQALLSANARYLTYLYVNRRFRFRV